MARTGRAAYMREYRARPGKREEHIRDNMRHYRERRKELDSIKLETGCVDCGYRGHPGALEFDHLPGSPKLFVVGNCVTRAWSKVLEEIAKCEVVCANCHRVRTAERRA